MVSATSATPNAGYSGTPLERKLGLKDGQRVAFVGLPETLAWLATAARFAGADQFDNWSDLPQRYGQKRDVVHGFTADRDELESGLRWAKTAISDNGMIWVSWPKRASKMPTNITEDTIREKCLPMGLVDVKVCAVDEIWSGLKLMIRRELRGK